MIKDEQRWKEILSINPPEVRNMSNRYMLWADINNILMAQIG